MTDYLVKHLRSGDVSIKMPDGSIQYVNHVAADRIEQLEGALIAIIITAPFGKPQDIARAALGEKKDG
jgi:hypothetical protein